ncbi:Maf family protein [Paenibacillus camelliae]|uniref:Maf family protein n=1 Tax=Paenibacillus camelliae TaxID=512410 RepID=UPI00203FA829|nr:Maf family protein [Paenibacillus camelliae]MCM3632449.1 Maf family protein [Paenibacillus camelliae]
MNASSHNNLYISVSQLVLASSSPRRKELVALLDLSLPVSVFSVEVDESIKADWKPAEAVEQLSMAKAKAVAQAIADNKAPSHIDQHALILAADTVVVLDEQIIGKPRSRAEAVQTLKRLRGREHQVYTGVTLLHPLTEKQRVSHRATEVQMRHMSDSWIEQYVATGESDDKAGSYGIQGKGAIFVDGIHGCYFNVVGLPVSLVAQMLEENFQVNLF